MDFNFKQIKATIKNILRWLTHDNFKEKQLLTVDNLPVALRRPYIYSGYRLLNQPWNYYLHSIVHLHTESMNVWTHLVGLVIALFLMVDFLQGFNVANNKVIWPILCFSMCSLVMLLLSSTAHLLHSKSEWYHYVFFLLDYVGVCAYNFGTAVGTLHIFSSKPFYDGVKSWFLWANVLLTWFALFAICMAKIKLYHNNSKRKFWMLLGILPHGVFIASPLLSRYYECLGSSSCAISSLNHISMALTSLILSAIVFTAHAPERWMPGCCDIFGHSHQLFHIVGVFTVIFQIRAVKLDLEQSNTSQEFNPSLMNICLSSVSMIIIGTLTLVYFVRSITLTESSKVK